MSGWVRGRLPVGFLVMLTALGLLGVGLTEQTMITVKHPEYAQQLAAAKVMARASEVIRDLKLSLNIPIDRQLDPNMTGLIGAEYTELTTSLGSLDAKRTSTNPAFAAMMVKYFSEAGLTRGDLVAIGASGSFPALIVATLSAAWVLELRPLVIYSVGSSMYGANIPGLTFVEMLDQLNKAGIFSYRLLAISPGGDRDQAEGLLTPFPVQTVSKLGEAYGVPVIIPDSLAQSITTRMYLYAQAAQQEPIQCFVNIGGASANFGETQASLKFPNGLVLQAPIEASGPERGLIFEYAETGIPIVNLLNIKGLALQNGLPIDPYPMPEVGEGGVYGQVRYRTWLALSILVLIGALASTKNYADKHK